MRPSGFDWHVVCVVSGCRIESSSVTCLLGCEAPVSEQCITDCVLGTPNCANFNSSWPSRNSSQHTHIHTRWKFAAKIASRLSTWGLSAQTGTNCTNLKSVGHTGNPPPQKTSVSSEKVMEGEGVKQGLRSVGNTRHRVWLMVNDSTSIETRLRDDIHFVKHSCGADSPLHGTS